jgi:hypothetical protein
VDDSGVFEWFYYEPKVDAMIAPFLSGSFKESFL